MSIVGVALRTNYGFPLDDSYIHQTISRNIAHSHRWLSGETSPLWAYVQVTNYTFFKVDPVAFNLALGLFALILIGVLLFELAWKDGLSEREALLLAVSPALCGNLIWLAFVGMEHLFFTAALLMAIHLWFQAEKSKGSMVFAGICAGTMLFIRPESIFFAPLAAVTTAKTRQVSSKVILSILGIWSIFVSFSLALNRQRSHSLLPSTLKGRAWLYFRNFGGQHSVGAAANFCLQAIGRVSLQFPMWLTPKFPRSVAIILSLAMPCILLAPGVYELISRSGRRLRLLFLCAAVQFCVFLFSFPNEGQGGRYLPLDLLLMFPCMLYGLNLLLCKVSRLRPVAMKLSVGITLVLGAISLNTWRIVTGDSIRHINLTHAEAAEWIRQNAPSDKLVAAFDIGRIGFTTQQGFIDLGGLTDPSVLPYMRDHQVPIYLRLEGVSLVVLPSGPYARDLGFSAASMVKLAEFCSPIQLWVAAFTYTGNASQCQSIYHLD